MDLIYIWLPRIGSFLLLCLGCIGLINPRIITDGVGMELTRPMAMSEARSAFGGLFIGLAAALLVLDVDIVYACVGAGFLGVVLTRLFSMVVDDAPLKDSAVSIVIDGIIAILLLAPLSNSP